MKTSPPIPEQTLRKHLEHLNQAKRFLILVREPNGGLTYTVEGSSEDIQADLAEFATLISTQRNQ